MGLRINNLTKSFGKDVKISNFSYNFPDIGVFAIIGESGVGRAAGRISRDGFCRQ